MDKSGFAQAWIMASVIPGPGATGEQQLFQVAAINRLVGHLFVQTGDVFISRIAENNADGSGHIVAFHAGNCAGHDPACFVINRCSCCNRAIGFVDNTDLAR